MKYTDAFTKNRQALLTALARAYGDVESHEGKAGMYERIAGDVDYDGEEKNLKHKKLVQGYVPTAKVPDFYVIVLADIVTGLEVRTYIYLKDLLRGMTDLSFSEEYTRRLITDDPTGQTSIINDKTGRHLKTFDLTWPEFLTKQIVTRIKFKYAQSDFPPSDDTESEILKITAQTLNGYSFDEFSNVELTDLADNKSLVLDKTKLTTFEDAK